MKHKKVIIVAVICLILVLIPLYLNHPNRKYKRAVNAFDNEQYKEAEILFEKVPTYKDSAMYLSYLNSLEKYNIGDFENAENGFRELGSFLDSAELVNACVQEQQVKRYETALLIFEKQSYAEAGKLFKQLGSYEKSKEYSAYCDGMVHFSEGEYREAQESFLKISGFLDTDTWIEASSMMEQETIYRDAVSLFENEKIKEARDLFQKIPGYEDASDYYRYTEGLVALEEKNYTVAVTSFQSIPGFLDSDDLAKLSSERQISQQYQDAVKLFKETRYKEATSAFASISDYADSEYYIEYMSAMEALNSEKYPEAIEKFRRMETFLDSKHIADEAEKQYFTILYNNAVAHFDDENYADALELFELLGDYSDAAAYKAYLSGIIADEKEDYLTAYEAYETIPDFKDSKNRARASRNAYLEQQYQTGVRAVSEGDFGLAMEAFSRTDGYKDTSRYIAYINGRDALEHLDYRKAEATFSELGHFLDSREMMEFSKEKLLPIHYETAMEALKADQYEEALEEFEIISGYRDADHYAEYTRVLLTAYVGDYQDAIAMLDKMEDFSDKENLRTYIEARQAESKMDYEKAIVLYQQISSFRDSEERLIWLPDMILDRDFDLLADKLTARNWWNQRLMNEVNAILQKNYQVTNTTMKLRFLALANSFLENGDFEHSYQLTEQIAEQDESLAPKLLDIQYLYALTEMEKNSPEQAEWMLEELTEQNYPDAQELLEQCWKMLEEKAQENEDAETAEYYQKKRENAAGKSHAETAGPEANQSNPESETESSASLSPDNAYSQMNEARTAFEQGKAAFSGTIIEKMKNLVEEAEQVDLASFSDRANQETSVPDTETGTEPDDHTENGEPTKNVEDASVPEPSDKAEPQKTDESRIPSATPAEAEKDPESAA